MLVGGTGRPTSDECTHYCIDPVLKIWLGIFIFLMVVGSLWLAAFYIAGTQTLNSTDRIIDKRHPFCPPFPLNVMHFLE